MYEKLVLKKLNVKNVPMLFLFHKNFRSSIDQ